MRKLFQLVGEIALDGVQAVEKGLASVDDRAKQLSKQLAKSGRDVTKLGTALTKGLTAPIVAAAGGIAVLAGKTGEYADHLHDLEQITGLSTDTLQEFEHVSRVAGVSFDGLTGIVSKFTNQIPEIAKGTGPAADAIKLLGVNIFDSTGKTRDMNSLFPELIDKLQSVENVTDRNAIAQDIFGRSLADLAPVLGLTKDQLAAARKEAHDLGIVMSGDALNAADNLRVDMERLKAQFGALWRDLAVDFVPILRDTIVPIVRDSVIPALKSMGDRVRSLADRFNRLSPGVKDFVVKAAAFLAVAGPALVVFGKMITAVSALRGVILLLNTALLTNPFVLAATALAGVAAIMLQADKNARKLRETLVDDTAKKQTESLKSSIEELIPLYGKLANADVEIIPEDEYFATKKRIEDLETNIADLGYEFTGSFGSKAVQAENALTDLADATEDASDATVDYSQNLDINYDALTKQSEAAEAAKRIAEERAKIEEDAKRRIEDLVAAEESRLAVLELQKAREIDAAQKVGAATTDIERYYALEREIIISEEKQKRIDAEEEVARKRTEAAEKLKEQQKKDHEEEIARIEERGNALTSWASNIDGVLSGFSQNQLMRLDQEQAREKAKIEASAMSEEAKQAAIQELEEKTDKKRRIIARRQAIADKLAALFSIGVNTAVAVVKSLPNFFLAGAVGILGAAQAAIVASRPIPELAEGGMVKKRDGGTVARLGEGLSDEVVIPLDRSMGGFVDAFVERLRDFRLPSLPGAPSLAAAGGGMRPVEHHWHIGTFIGDDRGYKELARRIEPIMTSEKQRRGM